MIVLPEHGEIYRAARKVLTAFGCDLFFAAGTLLGTVRDGGLIDDDDDIDAAYVSGHANGADAAEELAQVGVALNAAGLDAHVSLPMRTHLHVHHWDRYEARIDVFHYYFDEYDRLRLPGGVATASGDVTSWAGSQPATFEEIDGLIPVDAETLLWHQYGPAWRVPLTGDAWSWAVYTQRVDSSAWLSAEQVDRVEASRPATDEPRPECEKRADA